MENAVRFAFPAVLLLVMCAAANAAILTEQPGGTGQLPADAQVFDALSTTGIIGNLSSPVGGFPGNTVDLYRFMVASPFLLSAATVGLDGVIPDPQLFLFNSSGTGLLWNNDRALSPVDTQAALPRANYGPGVYYLGISWFAADPVDAFGEYLFDALGSNGGGPVNTNPLAGWVDTGAPTVWDHELYGIEFDLTAIPEPSTLTLVFAGTGLLIGRRLRA